ncbi:MAG: hypothetical protein ACC652_15955, partial [Acidimicrobiales bacterium]
LTERVKMLVDQTPQFGCTQQRTGLFAATSRPYWPAGESLGVTLTSMSYWEARSVVGWDA